jgi:cytochrome b561
MPLHLLPGGLIFLLTASRLWIRVEQGVPNYLRKDAKVMKLLSLIVH